MEPEHEEDSMKPKLAYENFSIDAFKKLMIDFEGCIQPPPGVQHVVGAPAFELLSVLVKSKTNSSNANPWSIWGTIQEDEEDLFNRSPDNPQLVTETTDGFLLSLSSDLFTNFFPALELSVDLMVMDSGQNLRLVQGTLMLDYRKFDKFDKVEHHRVEGDQAILDIKCTTYRAAVYAFAKILLKKKEDINGDGLLDVSGSIYASCLYDSNEYTPHPHSGSRCNCIALFGFTSENVKVTMGKPMELSRSLIVVPAYSVLMIETNLNVDHVVVRKVVGFPARDHGTFYYDFEGSNGLVFQVQVEWVHPNYLKEIEEAPENESELCDMRQEKRQRVNDHERALSSQCLYDIPSEFEFDGERLMEVFSVLICPNNDEECKISGTIEVDNLDIFKAYEKDESCPEKFAGNKTLYLRGREECFGIGTTELVVDLKNNGRQFCKGYLGWDDHSLRNPIWLDTRLCSVIKGELGYVAVHYAIFSTSVEAKVKVFFSSTSPFEYVNISGNLVATYSEDQYETYYEQEYYRSILFSCPEWESVLLSRQLEQATPMPNDVVKDARGIPLPLLKSTLCVPKDNLLVVDVNLSVSVVGTAGDARAFSGIVKFEVGHNICHRIESGGFRMDFFVEWDALRLYTRSRKLK